jgi:hypothetical protein
MFSNIQIKVPSNIQKFCLNYVKNNLHDRSYNNDELLEYYPIKDNFVTNFEFESVCIGMLPLGSVVKHIDDGRDSALILPITKSPITIITDYGPYTFDDCFLIDTTQKHGAMSEKNSIFLAIDFKKTFLETKKYLEKFTKLMLDTKCI